MERKKVMVVDSNTLLSRTIDICLGKKGHEVVAFSNGADAVKYLFEEKPDSVVLDIRLPDCDGWFIAKLVGKLGWSNDVPLIVVSALEPNSVKMSELKPYAYIQKPFDMGHLLQTIETSLIGCNTAWQMAKTPF